MNKEQFITQLDKLLPNKFGLQLKIVSMADEYAQSQALQQCDVLRLRELLVQRLNRLEEAHLVCDSILSCTDISYEKQEISALLKQMDILSPVA